MFTDADHTKLNAIEANATADQTAAEIRTLVESATDSNVFTDADHTKLNAIEANATADQTASEILTAIKTVDGTGSGLDADTVDGIEATSFLRSDADDSFSGTITNGGTFVSSHNSGTPSTNLKFGRSGSQYYTFHGSSSGNFLTSVSATSNQKPSLKFGYSIDGGSTLANDYTLNGSSGTIWHTGNDGTGSGLDADTVDGIEASAFLQTSGGTMTGNLSLGDNDELRFGDSDDLVIEHNGTFGDILNRTSVLAIRNAADNQDVVIQTDDGSGSVTDYFRADGSSGEAQLYHYGSEKLNTSSTGVSITGNLALADNGRLRLGASNDLDIYHDGANSYIAETGAGALIFRSNTYSFRNSANTEQVMLASENGAVILYHDNSAKLATSSAGVDVTGSLTTSDEVVAEVVAYNINQNAPYMIAATTSYTGAATNSGTYGLQHRYKYDSGGSHRITVDAPIGGVATEIWALYGGSGNMDVYGSLDVGAHVELPDNGELRFGDSDDLTIKHNATNGSITNKTNNLYLTNTADDKDIVIQSDDGSGGITNYFLADGSTGEAKMYYYGSAKVTTQSYGAHISGGLTLSAADPYIKLTDTSTGADHEIDANSGVGNLVINADINGEGSDPKLLLKVAGTTGITVKDTGNVDIAVDLTVGQHVYLPDNGELRFGDSSDLIIEHNASNGDIRNNTNDLLIRNLANDRDVRILSDDGSGGTADYFRADGSTGEAMLYFYGSEKFATKTGGAEVTGDFTATGNVTAYSDERLKENIKPIENAVDKVKQLRGVTYDWKETGEASVGVIAQEVEAVFPELVVENEEYKSVDYGKLTSVLIEAIKEQQAQIDELKAKLGE